MENVTASQKVTTFNGSEHFVYSFVKLLAIGQLDVELTVTRTSWHHEILMVIGKGVNFCARECLLFACNF